MTHRQRTSFLLSPLAALALAACSGTPSLSVDTPAEGAALGPALDLDPAQPGLQLAVTGKTSAAAWSRVTAFAGAEIAETTVQDGAFTFPSVTLPDGNPTLRVYVIDKDSQKTARLDRTLVVDSLAHGCVFLSPDEGTVVRTDPGDTGLVELPVRVRCAGLGPTDAITVKAGGTELPQQQFPAFDGTATFPVTLLPGLNLIELLAPGIPMRILRVTLDVRRCRVELSPLPGTTFNLEGNVPDSVADTNPNGPGIQAHIVAHTDCGDGVAARLAVTRLGAQTVTVSGVTQGGAAQFDLTLPEGPLLAQAFVGDPGATGASRRAAWSADSVQATVRLTSPGAGELLTDAEDAVPELEGLQVRIAGKVTGLDAGGLAQLELDLGSPQGGQLLPLTVSGGDFSVLVTLPNGPHTMQAFVQRASGNEARTSRIPFETLSQGGASVAIVSPHDGDALGLGLLVPQPGGAQALFSVHTTRMPGAAVTVKCGAAQGQATVDANGDASVPVVLPLAGCGRQNVTCTALATGAVGAVSSAPITLAIDATAPVVTLSSPVSGATRTAQADVLATTSCPGELQSWSLKINGAEVGHGLLSSNALSVQAIALQPGDNVFSLTVADEVQNQSAPATATVTLLTGVPQVAITAPAAGATLGTADDLDADLSNGLQIPVRVQVDNRPAGTQVRLVVTGSGISTAPLTAATLATGGHFVATFASVTLPEGPVQLQASVTDPVTPPVPPQTATTNVTVSTGRALCAIADPLDGTIWSAADDTVPGTPGVQHDVKVQTSGDGAITLTVTPPSGGPLTSAQSAPAGSGLRTATFPAQTFAVEGLYTLDATCAQTSGSTGRAVQTRLTLQLGGPTLSFDSPLAGGLLPATAFDANGNASVVVRAAGAGATGGTASLTFDCGSGATTLGPSAIPAGGLVTFAAALVPAGQEADCVLTATGQSAGGLPGLSASIAVRADRSLPAPSFTTPLDGAQYGPAAPELDCSTPSLPTLRTVDLALADPVAASGLVLVVTAAGTPTTLSQTPTPIAGGWRWSNVTVANGANALSVTATDATGNSGSASVGFATRCSPGNVVLSLVVSGNKLGYAQDKDHSTAGLQLGASVTATLADGSPVRVCSTLGDAGLGTCALAGTAPVATSPAALLLSGGAVSFDLTLADGPQALHAEVTDAAGTDASGSRSVTVRATPPRVSSLVLTNDTNSDGALNQVEQDASATLQFQVSFAAGAAITGQTVQIFSQSLAGALGSATAAGAGPIVVPVPVPLSAVAGSGGLQDHVFYARTTDDAGNVNSIPGDEYPGDPATTLGTTATPFVIAPAPSVAITRPGNAVTTLLEIDDVACAGSVCPGVDPLSYALSATTSAADVGTTLTFKLDGVPLGAGVTPSGGAVVNAVRALANGPARVLLAHVTDRYANQSDSSPRTLAIDSVPPTVAFAGLPTPADSFPQTIDVTTGTSLEAGQVISISSDRDGLVGSAPAAGATTTVTIRLVSTGAHQLTASAKDAAGNAGVSAPLAVTQNFSGPTLVLAQPAPSAGTVWFGQTTDNGSGRCAPALSTQSTNAPDGTPVTLWVAAADCSAGPNGTAQTANVASNTATFTNLLTFAAGATGVLCGEVTVAAQTAHTAPQAFGCDLATPVVSWVAPAAGQLFVAPSPSLPAGAIASQGSDPATLVADFSVQVTGPSGAKVELFEDGAGTPFASTTLSSAANATTVPFTGASLAIPAAQALAHTLTGKVTSPSGNAASTPVPPATYAINVDINPPAQVTPTLTASARLSGKVHVDVGTLPGDDGTLGGAPLAWEVRYSLTAPLTKANWFTAGTKMTGVPPPPATTFDLVLPTDQPTIWFGVRAVDRVGNLGGFTDQSAGAPTLVTALARTSISVGPANGLPSGAVPVSPALRVGDFDGDGFDDVAIAYPYDDAGRPQDCAFGYCDGTIRVYFGSVTGLDPVPLILTGSIPGGALGLNQSFDVGDFDADGKADIAAGETDLSTAAVHVWKGTALAAAKPTKGAVARITLTDTAPNNLLGGTVRAVGRPTAGVAAGDDLALSNYTAGSGVTSGLTLAVLPRGGGWLAGSASTITTFGAFSIALPSTGLGNGQTDVAPLGDVDLSGKAGLFVSFVETTITGGVETSKVRDLRAFPGGALVPGSAVPQSAATVLPGPATGSSLRWGFAVAGGRDAAGDGTPDLLVADLDLRRINLYDGSGLLTGTSQPLEVLDVASEADADVGACALFLPDLDGDGKAELTGCATAGRSSAAYLGFGFPGTTPPLFSFFAPNPPGWTFLPHRGQKITPSGVFGQAVAAGHFSSTSPSALEVLVLSHTVPVSAPEALVRVR